MVDKVEFNRLLEHAIRQAKHKGSCGVDARTLHFLLRHIQELEFFLLEARNRMMGCFERECHKVVHEIEDMDMVTR